MSIFNIFKKLGDKKRGVDTTPPFNNPAIPPAVNNSQHYPSKINNSTPNIALPNGKIIAEQQQDDYKIAVGNYPELNPTYGGMEIVSSTVPPKENYACLNEDEQTFFTAFRTLLIEAKFKPDLVKLTRLSDGTFNVDYIGLCYIGKICLYKEPEAYAVIKKGGKRATKVFATFSEAQSFASSNNTYEIQTRQVQSKPYMQYLIGVSSVKELYNPSLQQCIDTIPRWIKYLNYCKKH